MRCFLPAAMVLVAMPCAAQITYDHAVMEGTPWNEGEAHRDLFRSDDRALFDYDVKYLRLEWQYDPAVRAIAGTVTTYFTATTELENVILYLSDTLTVDNVRYHGLPASSTADVNDQLIITLPDPLAPGTLDSVSVTYHGVPRIGTGFGAFMTSEHEGTPVLWTLSEPYGAKEWWPCKQDLHDKIDSIDAFVTVPNAYRPAGNGLLVGQSTENDRTTYHWKHRYPIAHYLIATAATNYDVQTLPIPLGNDTVPMITYSYPENAFMAGLNAGDVLHQMQLYSQLFGTYPFAKEKYGHAQFGWGGGMEHQTMTFVVGYSYELSAHELAHQWFGDKVTCGSWQDIWLNEGFATYLQGMCYEYLVPEYWHGYLQGKINSVTSEPDGSVLCTDTTSVPRVFNTRLTYNKGAMLVHMLRWVCGDSAFFHGVNDYLNDPALAYGSARTSDLQAHLENTSGLDLDGFMADWFQGQGYPTYTLTWSQDSGGDVDVSLFQSPSHPSVDFFEMPVPVRFKNNDVDSTVVLQNTMNGQGFSFHLPFQADSALFDPDLWIVSRQNVITRVAELDRSAEPVVLFPDPATDLLTVRSPGVDMEGVRVFDGTGRSMPTASNGTRNSIDVVVRDLAPGCYIVELRYAGGGKRLPFIKQ